MAEKDLIDFYIHNKKTGAYRNECKKCANEKTKLWVKNNPEKRREISRRYDKAHPEQVKKKKANYIKKHPIEYRRWNLNNPEKVKEINRLYCQKNKDKLAKAAAARRAFKLQATPKWANEEKIMQIYTEGRRLKLEVDHIVPLKSKIVCGLHVEHNLQLLPTSLNRKKSNVYWPDMP